MLILVLRIAASAFAYPHLPKLLEAVDLVLVLLCDVAQLRGG